LKFSRADNLVKMWRFFPTFRKLIRSLSSGCVGCTLPNHQHTLKMGTVLLPETSEKFHILTRLSARENFIKCCRRESFKTNMTIYHYSPIYNLLVIKTWSQNNVLLQVFLIYQIRTCPFGSLHCPLTFKNRASYIVDGRTATLQMLHFIYFFSTNISTSILNMLHTLRFSLQNAVYFIMVSFLVPVLFTFYIQCVLKFKCKTPVPKG
jgi:hypothetical protein